jgi:hypothetical protein
MKFLIASLFITLFGCITSSAQVFKTGAILGLSASQVEGDGYGGYEKLGLIVGGFTNINLSEKLTTQFEIYYIKKGSKKNARPDKGDYESFHLNLNYIDVPVVIRYHYKKFIFETGLYAGALLSYKIEDQFGVREVQNYPFKKIDLGGLLGFSYLFNESFSFNIRSKASILPIRDFENQDANVGLLNKLFNRGWYNLDLNFSVRYQFGS